MECWNTVFGSNSIIQTVAGFFHPIFTWAAFLHSAHFWIPSLFFQVLSPECCPCKHLSVTTTASKVLESQATCQGMCELEEGAQIWSCEPYLEPSSLKLSKVLVGFQRECAVYKEWAQLLGLTGREDEEQGALMERIMLSSTRTTSMGLFKFLL